MHSSENEKQQNKSLLSNNLGKVIGVSLLFILFAGIITFLVSWPFSRIYSGINNFQVYVVGASESEWGINPQILDKETGRKSCLLAASGSFLPSRLEMLKSVIDHPSLELVVLDLSVFSINGDFKGNRIEERVLYFSRIDGPFHKMDTLFNKFSFWGDEYDQCYAEMLYEGLNSWEKVFDGTYNESFARHGYDPQKSFLKAFTPEESIQEYNGTQLDTNFGQEHINYLNAIIDLCRKKDVPIVLITIPVSERMIWQYYGWDKFHDFIIRYAQTQNVPYYDFNLLIDRKDYLHDDTCYRDSEHLSDAGATTFSMLLSELINSTLQGETCPFQFYSSYEEAKQHSSYTLFPREF